MSEEKQLTSYPSIDKPWLKYYRNTPIRKIDMNQTIYQLIFDSNKNNMSDSAIEYLGTSVSFQKVKEKTDKTASAFYSIGLRKGDVVLVGVSNCPEVVYCLLALNKIGAVTKWFDIRAGEKDIEEYANDNNCKYLIAFDMLVPKIKNIISKTKLDKVFVVTPADSLSLVKRTLYKYKEHISFEKDGKFVCLYDFVNKQRKITEVEPVEFDETRPSIMVQSSGTTGKPKIIVHSDKSAIQCAISLSYSDLPLGEGKTLLNLLPPWIAYSLGAAIIYPLAMGSKVILSPSFEPNVIMKYIGEFTISMTAPAPYRYLYDHFDDIDKSKLEKFYNITETMISGGDKISIEENEKFERRFQTKFVNGYGNNEGWGCLTVNPINHNKYGSVGIAKFGENVIAYDNAGKKEMRFGEDGEICFHTQTAFLYYESNRVDTDAVKQVHNDGKIWLHTGDLGYIDDEGFVFLKGRLRRVITRRGFKISAYTIEDKISECEAVKEVVAVEVDDAADEHVPMAFVVLNKGFCEQDAISSILIKCKNELKEYEVPKYVKVLEVLPYTQNGKYDFRMLENQGNEFVEQYK